MRCKVADKIWIWWMKSLECRVRRVERERELSRAGSSAVGSDGRTDESRPPSHQVVGSRAFALWKTQEHGKGGGYGGRRRRRTAILFHPVKDREKRGAMADRKRGKSKERWAGTRGRQNSQSFRLCVPSWHLPSAPFTSQSHPKIYPSV